MTLCTLYSKWLSCQPWSTSVFLTNRGVINIRIFGTTEQKWQRYVNTRAMLYFSRDTMDESEKKNIRIEGDSTMFKNIRQNNSLKAFQHWKKTGCYKSCSSTKSDFLMLICLPKLNLKSGGCDINNPKDWAFTEWIRNKSKAVFLPLPSPLPSLWFSLSSSCSQQLIDLQFGCRMYDVEVVIGNSKNKNWLKLKYPGWCKCNTYTNSVI